MKEYRAGVDGMPVLDGAGLAPPALRPDLLVEDATEAVEEPQVKPKRRKGHQDKMLIPGRDFIVPMGRVYEDKAR
jgi:hypothetical protein